MLGECTKESLGHCVLSRTFQPNYRETFENQVVKAILAKASTTKHVQYVGFASGGMFQDLVILAKALSKKPNAKITIHLIDHKNLLYADYKDLEGISREVIYNENINPRKIMREFVKNAKMDNRMDEGLSDAKIEKDLTITSIENDLVFK